jgi:hypothetical protein
MSSIKQKQRRITKSGRLESMPRVQIPASPPITLNYFDSLQISNPQKQRHQTVTDIHLVTVPNLH